MKLQKALKSRTLTFNAAVGAVVPVFNHFFPQVALTADMVNNILILGNIALRFMTEKAVGASDEEQS